MTYLNNKFFFLFLFISFIAEINFSYSKDTMYWWHASNAVNFGDDLSHVIVEKILGRPVKFRSLSLPGKTLLSTGSVLHFARDGDCVWGSGFRENPLSENRFKKLDVRAVRGPRTRNFLLQMGICCPEVYGDPAILMGYLFPEFKKKNKPSLDYIIIPNIGEIQSFSTYKNVVNPTLPWREIVQKMCDAKLVISSSLHGLIVAESYGIPARLIKMSWFEPLLKYADYYESTGRLDFKYATSVKEALKMGGERPPQIDINLLLASFPWNYFEEHN